METPNKNEFTSVCIKTEPPDHLLEDFIMNTNINEVNAPVVKEEQINITTEHEYSNRSFVTNDIHVKQENENLYENHEVQGDFVIGLTGMVNVPVDFGNNLPTNSETFICNLSNDNYSSDYSLTVHMKTHFETKQKPKRKKVRRKKEFQCYICNEMLPNRGSLTKHKKFHIDENEGRPLICGICKKSFKTFAEADSHNKLEHTRILKAEHKICVECGETFDKYKDWYNHKFKHKDEKLICDLCKKSFKKIAQLQAHLERHARDEQYKCGVCNEGFSCPSKLAQHISFKQESFLEKNKKDNITESIQPTGPIYDTNLPIKSDKLKRIKSDRLKTTKTFHHKDLLRTQLLKQIPETMDLFLPIHIQGTIDSSRTKQVKQYTDEYFCDGCDKSFSSKRCLNRHKLTHTEQRPFACDVCDKTFTQKPHLVSHHLVHTGEKPFQCEFCSKRFTRNFYLITHMRSHTGNNLFKCEACSKEFTRKSSLTQHLKIHMGIDEMQQDSFKCHECDRFFVTRSSYRHHRDLRHLPARYSCDFCDKRFRYKSDHERHNKTHKSDLVCSECHMYFRSEQTMIGHQCVLNDMDASLCVDVSLEEDKEIVLGM